MSVSVPPTSNREYEHEYAQNNHRLYLDDRCPHTVLRIRYYQSFITLAERNQLMTMTFKRQDEINLIAMTIAANDTHLSWKDSFLLAEKIIEGREQRQIGYKIMKAARWLGSYTVYLAAETKLAVDLYRTSVLFEVATDAERLAGHCYDLCDQSLLDDMIRDRKLEEHFNSYSDQDMKDITDFERQADAIPF